MYYIERVRPGNSKLEQQVEQLLDANGLRRDPHLDYTCVLCDSADDAVIATGSCFRSTLRCLAVQIEHQGEGLLNQIVSHLLQVQLERGNYHVLLYTKSKNVPLFSSLGFAEIVRSPDETSLLENRSSGFYEYCQRLKGSHVPNFRAAAVVLNANPFTLGHRALIECAYRENDEVHVFIVSEDLSLIPFSVRSRLIREGVADLPNVICHESGLYMISSATFPSYFLKDQPTANECHARMDAELFCKIAKSVGIAARYLGEEPTSQVTSIYNQVLSERLPQDGITCVIVPRKTAPDGRVISASTVRMAICRNDMETLRCMTPESTWQYFSSPEAVPVIETIRHGNDVLHY